MPTNFPTSVDVLVNPTPTDSLNAPAHSTQHANANDAIEAIEGYLLTAPFGLRLVKKQTVGTGVTSVNVTSAFSATYENYRIIWNGGTGSVDNELRIQMGATTTGYYYNNFGTSWTTTFVGGGSPGSGNRWEGAGTIITTTGAHLDVEINNPFASSRTIGKGSQVNTGSARTTMFMLNNTTSYTDFTISPQVGTLTGGTIYVYGYTK
jgi:hypothetical protein